MLNRLTLHERKIIVYALFIIFIGFILCYLIHLSNDVTSLIATTIVTPLVILDGILYFTYFSKKYNEEFEQIYLKISNAPFESITYVYLNSHLILRCKGNFLEH